MIRAVRLKAYAKLNLGLRVLYKRSDNYHELRTVFQTISLADDLAVEYSAAKETSVRIEGTPEIPDNLVERAARIVLQEMKLTACVRFGLTKRVPSGAGLGGGSSDAAAVLLALPVLAGKRVPADRLHTLAAELGSDVPFFLEGGTALGLGRGEELYPLPDRGAVRGLLVSPAIHSGTAEAYRDVSARLTSIPLQNKLFSFRQEVWQAGQGASSGFVNDFEEGVFGRHPSLRQIAQRLLRSGAKPVSMTGSGSSLFGIYADRERLKAACRTFSGERVFEISFLSRSRYRAAWRRALREHTKGDQWPPQSRYAR